MDEGSWWGVLQYCRWVTPGRHDGTERNIWLVALKVGQKNVIRRMRMA